MARLRRSTSRSSSPASAARSRGQHERGFFLKPCAQADLDEIWDYTAGRWGRTQAETYIRQLWKDIAAVGHDPALGRECTHVRPGYRKHASGWHVLFYRRGADGVEVVRVLHQRMDYEQHDFD